MKYVYRIVNIILAAIVFPCTLFLNFVYFGIEVDAADAAMVESMSLMRIINIFRGKDSLSTIVDLVSSKNSTGAFLWPQAFEPINTRILIFVICFVLTLLIALFIIIWSICTGKRLPILIASVLGLAATIIMVVSFRSFAMEIVNGNIDLIQAFGGSGILASIAGSFLSVYALALDGFDAADLIIYIALILWTAIFYLVELGDPKVEEEKSKKKAAKAQKKLAKSSK